MEKTKSATSINFISEEDQTMIIGGGAWVTKALIFVILNWDEIRNGFTDGYNSYHN